MDTQSTALLKCSIFGIFGDCIGIDPARKLIRLGRTQVEYPEVYSVLFNERHRFIRFDTTRDLGSKYLSHGRSVGSDFSKWTSCIEAELELSAPAWKRNIHDSGSVRYILADAEEQIRSQTEPYYLTPAERKDAGLE